MHMHTDLDTPTKIETDGRTYCFLYRIISLVTISFLQRWQVKHSVTPVAIKLGLDVCSIDKYPSLHQHGPVNTMVHLTNKQVLNNRIKLYPSHLQYLYVDYLFLACLSKSFTTSINSSDGAWQNRKVHL